MLALTSVTGHAIDDSFCWWQQASFLLHTVAGLTWLGGLIGLVWWMFTGRDKPPEVAAKLADRWSLVAKIAIVIVVISGIVMAWENVGSFANLLATPYGRLLTIKLALFCASCLRPWRWRSISTAARLGNSISTGMGGSASPKPSRDRTSLHRRLDRGHHSGLA